MQNVSVYGDVSAGGVSPMRRRPRISEPPWNVAVRVYYLGCGWQQQVDWRVIEASNHMSAPLCQYR
jgi:hypothetical protein